MIYGFRRMIYLLRKHDIISVPSYAAGIYHLYGYAFGVSIKDIISKIYHPFRIGTDIIEAHFLTECASLGAFLFAFVYSSPYLAVFRASCIMSSTPLGGSFSG